MRAVLIGRMENASAVKESLVIFVVWITALSDMIGVRLGYPQKGVNAGVVIGQSNVQFCYH